ncbi:hypothetical protein WJS89_11835 [Sphingomicrobium sp. XHP0235]|uniref:hypothetical protein n=1 Tax=Sphingomicrobium aquimarinum TaxID=3133971 RepID=UPI0031FE462B
MRILVLGLAGFAIFGAYPALACRDYMNAPPMPGESWDEFSAREKKVVSDLYQIEHYEREKLNFEEAETVYLAKVVKAGAQFSESVRTAEFYRATEVEPVTVFKGDLPTTNSILRTNLGPECWVDGNGFAGALGEGDFAIIFLGVETHGHDGVDSIAATDARYAPIVNSLMTYVLDMDGGPVHYDEASEAYLFRQEDGSFKPGDF